MESFLNVLPGHIYGYVTTDTDSLGRPVQEKGPSSLPLALGHPLHSSGSPGALTVKGEASLHTHACISGLVPPGEL